MKKAEDFVIKLLELDRHLEGNVSERYASASKLGELIQNSFPYWSEVLQCAIAFERNPTEDNQLRLNEAVSGLDIFSDHIGSIEGEFK